MLFSYKFFTFSQLFSQHPNKFYYRKFQNHSQIPIHRTNHSQIPTPHTTETPIQPTAANFGNQKPQPPKHHYHTTTTTTKIKITERDCGSKALGQRRDRATQCDWRVRSSDWSLGFAGDVEGVIWAPSSSSLSLFVRLTWKWFEVFEVKIFTSNHFQGQSLILHGQLQIASRKFIFHAQPNTHIYGKAFSKVM